MDIRTDSPFRNRFRHPFSARSMPLTLRYPAPTATPAPALSFLNPAGLYDPRPHGYSHVAVVPGPLRTVFVAGQGGEDASGVLPTDFAAQVRQAFANLATALAAAGAQPRDVAKLTLLVVDHTEERLHTITQAVHALWRDAPTPACTLIPVPRLALDGMLFEVDATAVAGRSHG